jgi:hypothetical protein
MTQRIIFIAWLFLLPALLEAQQPQPAWGPDSKSTDDAPLAVPVTLNGQGGSLAFQSETPTESYLSGGIGFTGVYTDNALLTNTNQIGNFSYMVQPDLVWSQITPRLTWNLGLNGGFIVNNNLGAENQAAETANLGATWRMTQHVSLRLDDTFSNVTGLFSAIGNQTAATGVGVVEQSNNTLLVPGAQRVLSNLSLAELSVQLGPNTVAGVRGTYWLLDYPTSAQTAQPASQGSPTPGTLFDTRAYSAEVFYDWHFAPRQWLGATLRGQQFETIPAIAKTDVGSFLMNYSITPTPTLSLTLFGGPEYSDTPPTAAATALNFTGQGRFWASSEGATLDWGGARTSVDLSFSRQLNDGGGLATPVTLQSVSARLRQQLGSHHNEVQFGIADSKSDPILSGPTIEGLSVFAMYQQRFTRNLVGRLGYTWQRQDLPAQATVPDSGISADANRVWFSVNYDFSHAIGK